MATTLAGESPVTIFRFSPSPTRAQTPGSSGSSPPRTDRARGQCSAPATTTSFAEVRYPASGATGSLPSFFAWTGSAAPSFVYSGAT